MELLAIEPNVYYTVEEAAAKLRVPQRTVLRLLRTGVIRGVKIGNRWRILGASLLEMGYTPASPKQSLTEVLERIYARQRDRGYVPPTPEEVDAYLRAERAGWDE